MTRQPFGLSVEAVRGEGRGWVVLTMRPEHAKALADFTTLNASTGDKAHEDADSLYAAVAWLRGEDE